jgi:hypothetical protein
MKTPYAKYWMTAELLHALGPEDDDAELRAWVSAELDDGLRPGAPAPAPDAASLSWRAAQAAALPKSA